LIRQAADAAPQKTEPVHNSQVKPSTRLGRDMQWYVYLITIPAVLFLVQIAVELFGQPIQTILRIRQQALERLLAFHRMKLPRPRETAVSSQQIREHDWAARNVRQAQLTFADLGSQLVAFSEAEPTTCTLMRLCGLDIVLAGHELIKLSQVYAAAKSDSDELRLAIEDTHHAVSYALALSRPRSGGDELTKIQLEPMYLRDAASSRHRKRPPGQPRAVPRHAPARARPAANPVRRFAR